MSINRLSFLVAFLLLGKATCLLAASDIVLVDQGEAAYTVFAGLPKEREEGVRTKLANESTVLVVSREVFSAEREKYVQGHVVQDAYPGSRAVDGIVALVSKYPGTPFGLTWNGGIAFTRTDYQHAKRLYEACQKNVAECRRTPSTDPHADPINPQVHLGPLLGW